MSKWKLTSITFLSFWSAPTAGIEYVQRNSQNQTASQEDEENRRYHLELPSPQHNCINTACHASHVVPVDSTSHLDTPYSASHAVANTHSATPADSMLCVYTLRPTPLGSEVAHMVE